MILDINTSEDGRWFDWFYSHLDPTTMEPVYDDPVEGAPKMKIRNPGPLWKKQSENRKTEIRMILNSKSRSMEAVEVPIKLTSAEKTAQDEEFADFVIAEADGFTLDGKVLTGTREEKIQMMKQPQVSMFVMRCVQILQESSVTEAAAEEKNLSTGLTSPKDKPETE